MSAALRRWLCAGLGLLLAGSLALAEEFLDPAVAFRATARALDAQTIEVRFAIADGYYLYRDRFRFAAEPPGVRLGTALLPPGKEKDDETFGKVQVYYREAVIQLPVERQISGPLPLTLKVSSQGCAEAGICYPPQQQQLAVTLPDPGVAQPTQTTGRPVTGDESGRIAGLVRNSGFWLLLGSFFGFGLLLSLTPCIFPMIPILSAIIVGTGRAEHGVSHLRGFVLSLAYVLGMAASYAAAGVAAALTGTLLSALLQNPWVLGGFAAIFVVLSLSMFGFYELQMPAFVQTRVSDEVRHFRGGSLPGVAAMGALSAIIVGPCVAAPLAGALLYIGQTGDALRGGAALFAMGVGMGAPLLIVGASAGTLLPKSGPWMEAVRKAFGVVLLATALWIVSPVLPPVVPMLAWALLLIVPAIYLHALDPLPAHARGWQRFWKGIGIVMLLFGAALLLGTLAGSRDPLQPLSVLRSSAAATSAVPSGFTPVRSLTDLDARLAAAQQPALLDFYADWCASCKEMDRLTFSDPRVQARLSGWTLLRADVTANSPDDAALLRRFRLYGPPGIVFFDRRGQEVEGVRVIGFENADAFLAILARLD
ncbi:protein-disulfide reductase DsbD [Accumulibacter sp.]|uniref:protein-disulfide reductase DsbD n=1 Tax=Accumulibacter sp. TaxID=2053492 RepID=UPI0025F9E654|nr:protein-disulfide reductase DsbD [Accumulibacter sp.]MCM8594442.1 protein-disulfide reductase DsbD [Accumulibacter sp.]MCM8624922.1 protein-disulfide reductase DsbD [Accumulibacter sp.]MDS4048588.1 protein-disulfide reductase DsbD [Accumulibacter sp.]